VLSIFVDREATVPIGSNNPHSPHNLIFCVNIGFTRRQRFKLARPEASTSFGVSIDLEMTREPRLPMAQRLLARIRNARVGGSFLVSTSRFDPAIGDFLLLVRCP
jgi:hypothetical protein